MSEVEKLMQNAGIEIQYGYDVEYNKKSEHYRLLNCNKNAVITLFPEYKSKGYKVTKVNKTANFTAEKQLEIVKQILFSTWWINLKRLQFSEKFDEGLAQMINELWQDLKDTEKAEIKRILE